MTRPARGNPTPSLPRRLRSSSIRFYTTDQAGRYPPLLRCALPEARFLFCRSPAEAFAAARRLRLIQATSAGVDGFLRAPLPAGVPVCRAVGVFEERMAEYALAYLLAVSQGVPRAFAQQARRRWAPFAPQYLQGRLLGIAGYGAIGRGPVVQEAALLAALDRGWIAGAVLDVFAEEPLPPGHPLWRHPKVIVTPHIAGPAFPEREVRLLAENLRRLQAGRPLKGRVRRARGY